jgi:hypothetical protein
MILSSNGFPSSRRISQATLHKIFVGMMATAFGLYVIFTAYLIRHHHNNAAFDSGNQNNNKWGPNMQMDNDEILKAHIQKLREMQQLKNPASEAKNLLVVKKQQVDLHVVDGVTPKQPSLTLEEVDIHDMKHPKEIHKEPPHKDSTTLNVAKSLVSKVQQVDTTSASSSSFRTLKAYLEPIHLSDWDVKPLPVRNTTKEQLQVIEYPRVNSCQRLHELWPIDDFPDADPFLP